MIFNNKSLFVFLFTLVQYACPMDVTVSESKNVASTSEDTITIAILVKNMAHCLPAYLRCIEEQTFPKERTLLYIRTNNNRDNTVVILDAWVEQLREQNQYKEIHYDKTDLAHTKEKDCHDWSAERFSVLGKIRQASVDWALEKESHYFVADCDNFIKPRTVENLMEASIKLFEEKKLEFPPVVSALLRRSTLQNHAEHSTFYTRPPIMAPIKSTSFMVTHTEEHKKLIAQKVTALVEVPIAHCTYFVHRNVLPLVQYNDTSGTWEFAIFSYHMAQQNVKQFVDTRYRYGYLTDATTEEDLKKWSKGIADAWLKNLIASSDSWLSNLITQCAVEKD